MPLPKSHDRVVRGVTVPPFMYGTAWKEERTESLVRLALASGFRAIDTANQRRHYVEAAVGDAAAALIATGSVVRSELFLQTKFTYQAGQDHRLPYDSRAPITAQVEQSMASSLAHLQTTYVDSYVLHGPSSRLGLARADYEAWAAMEAIQRAGTARLLGVSNVSLEQLTTLHRDASVKPSFVQNRCYATTGWDRAVREFCSQNGIVYQAFSLLTANTQVLASAPIGRISQRIGRSPEQIVFRFALEAGMLPLTGTSSARHMQEDLECLNFSLDGSDVPVIEGAGLRA